jgi:hypothetical protein
MTESSSTRGGWPHPANFPLGSAESRAAARALADQRDKVDLQTIMDIPMPKRQGAYSGGCSYRCVSDGKVVEFVFPGEDT